MGLPPEYLIDVAAALRGSSSDGPIWSVACEQLNVNLLRLPTGDGIVEHITAGIDVVFVIFEGHGTLTVDGVAYPVGPGRVLVVPQGTLRALLCTVGPLVYLTCHRRRPGLMPV
jgi:mannose-6-phosphate isomerase-like protein (cupin superfamily)